MKVTKITLAILLITIPFGNAELMTIALAAKSIIEFTSAVVTISLPVIDHFKENMDVNYENHLKEIAKKIESFQMRHDTSTKKLLNEINIVNIKKYQTDINTAYNKYMRIISSSSAYTIVNEMNNFIREYSEDIDFKILDLLEQNHHLSESAIQHYANLAKSMSDEYKNELKFSPNSLVYEFQLSVYYYAMKYVAILECATKHKNYYERSSFNQQVWSHRRSQLNEKYENLIKISSDFVNSRKALSSLLHLTTNVQGNEASFKKVFQTYWKNEHDLTNKETCKLNCNFEVKDIADDYCNGRIGQCFYNEAFGQKVIYGPQLTAAPTKGYTDSEDYFISTDPQRIYTYYTLKGSPYGNSAAPYQHKFTMKPYDFWFYSCDICQCTCDQSNSQNSVRKIYGGVMNAPSGHVITGVRFDTSNNVLYMDIQYGKLVSGGIVDAATLTWSGSPSQLASNTFSIGFDLRNFALDDVYFEDGQLLTGIQLFPQNNLIRTKIYGANAHKQTNSVDWLQPYSNNGYSLINTNLNEVNVQGKKAGLNPWDSNLIVTRSDESNVYVQFSTSDERTDAGQTTVPFFDCNEVIQDFPLALSGIGYVHYSNSDYAGYLRPILKSTDIKYFL